MKRILLITLFLASVLYSKSQEPLPRGMTEEEKLIWNDYIKNLPSDKGTAPPASPPRAPAEWDEMQGVVITWASYTSNLREIVRYAKEVVKVYIVCSSQTSVQNYLAQGGINTTNIEFIVADFNSVWVRDYGPQSIYLEGTNDLAIVDWVYNRPRPDDDEIPSVIASHLGLPIYQMTAFPNRLVATGGNLMSDGLSSGFSSKLIDEENPGLNENEINTIAYNYMGIDPYIRMNTLPYDGIHHIDMHMKLLDEETLLVGQYPEGVSDGPQIESNLNYVLSNFKTRYGRPFKVVRIPMPSDQYGDYPSQGSDYLTYTNSLILNNLVLVPTYGRPQDDDALLIYQNAMPGYNVIGLNMLNVIPASGAIHCITHEIAAPDPIFISHASIREGIPFSGSGYTIKAHITSASGIEEAILYWSNNLNTDFNQVPMSLELDTFRAVIPPLSVNEKVYYYISATNENGKTLSKPLVAPSGYYTFEIEESTSLYDNKLRRINVFPNPTDGIIKIDITGQEPILELSIANQGGIVVNKYFRGENNNGNTYNISNLPSGIYIVTAKTKEQIFRTKIFKI